MVYAHVYACLLKAAVPFSEISLSTPWSISSCRGLLIEIFLSKTDKRQDKANR